MALLADLASLKDINGSFVVQVGDEKELEQYLAKALRSVAAVWPEWVIPVVWGPFCSETALENSSQNLPHPCPGTKQVLNTQPVSLAPMSLTDTWALSLFWSSMCWCWSLGNFEALYLYILHSASEECLFRML